MEEKEGRESSGKKQNGIGSRTSLKSDSEFNNYQFWKHKLRENCYKRVRQDRTRLLWKMRLPTSLNHNNHNQHQQDIVRSAFQDIVSDELKKMKDSPSDNSMKISISDSKMDDLLWEYDGVHTYQGECEEILLEMQKIFYEDLNSEPVLKESGIENWEDEVDEYLAQAVYEHMQLNADKVHREEIWCPICKRGELQEDHNLIYCTHCELRLNKANEVNLEFLRDRLAEAHSEHFDRGCRLKPRFCIKTEFNLTALYISCEGCDTFEVII